MTSAGLIRPSIKLLIWTLLAGVVFMVIEGGVIAFAGIEDSALHFGMPDHLNSLSDGVVLFVGAVEL